MHVPALPSLFPTKRCLLVLDLNGTLLHRRRTKSNINAHIYVRPYLGAFLRYISHPAAGLDVAVWSSARRDNVHAMVDRAWSDVGASRVGTGVRNNPAVLGQARFPDLVFAREDMLLTDRQFKRAFRHGTFNPDHNVRTTKDLRQLWLRLSLLREEQIRTHAQQNQPLRTPYDTYVHSDELTASPTGEIELINLRGPHDTILLDDSAHKARLQPNNHFSLPTYGAAELRTDAAALVSTVDLAHVDETLLAVIGILSEMCNDRVDEWTRSGRIWSGPGAQLDPYEMWTQCQKEPPSNPVQSSSSPKHSAPVQSLASRLNALSDTSESTIPPPESDPPFASSTLPTIPGNMTQWFTCPPLVHAWTSHGRRVLDRLGIASEHECVRVWPGWREGKLDIMGRAKDDVSATGHAQRGTGGKSKGQRKPKGEREEKRDRNQSVEHS